MASLGCLLEPGWSGRSDIDGHGGCALPFDAQTGGTKSGAARVGLRVAVIMRRASL